MKGGVPHVGFVSRDAAQTARFGKELGKALQPGDLILLDGPFGAGKTTLVQGLGRGAASPDRVTSPSFTLINEYSGRLPLRHVDLFRLDSLDVEIEQALENCVDGDGVTVVEWPALMPSDLQDGALRVEMRVLGDTDRAIVIHTEGSRWDPEQLERMMQTAMRGEEGQGD